MRGDKIFEKITLREKQKKVKLKLYTPERKKIRFCARQVPDLAGELCRVGGPDRHLKKGFVAF